MKIKRFNTIVSIILFVLLLGQTAPSQKETSLPIIKQFNKNKLGLMDISSDGKLLLLHQNIKEKRGEVSVRMHRIRIFEAISQNEIATLKFESDYPYMIFLPNTHEVFFTETLRQTKSKKFFKVWNPDTGKIRNLEELDAKDYAFVRVYDDKHLLMSVFNKEDKKISRELYNFIDRRLTPIDTRENELIRANKPYIFSPDKNFIISLKDDDILIFQPLEDDTKSFSQETNLGKITSFEYSPNEKYLTVISENIKGKEGIEFYLSIYNASDFKQISHKRIFIDEKIEERGLKHIGSQLGISPNSRWLIVGYDRLSSFFISYYSQAKYAVFEIPSGRYVGTVSHPPIKKAENWADISPAQSGRLRFSIDSSSFYTTSSYAIQWKLPQ